MAGVLGCNERDFSQESEGAQGHVLEIADRRRYEVKHAAPGSLGARPTGRWC